MFIFKQTLNIVWSCLMIFPKQPVLKGHFSSCDLVPCRQALTVKKEKKKSWRISGKGFSFCEDSVTETLLPPLFLARLSSHPCDTVANGWFSLRLRDAYPFFGSVPDCPALACVASLPVRRQSVDVAPTFGPSLRSVFPYTFAIQSESTLLLPLSLFCNFLDILCCGVTVVSVNVWH